MPVFVTSKSVARRHGVFAIEQTPPGTIRATGTSTSAIIEQFPWGPAQTLYTPSSSSDFIQKFAPFGMSHTGSGYLAFIRKAWPLLKAVRVIDAATAVQATATIPKSGPTNMLTLTLLFPGTAGNSVTATVASASDGDANHFNLTVTVTGASGTTTDTLINLNYSGVGADSVPDLTKTLLLGAITKLATGVPTPGTYTFSSGTNGTIDGTTYVGTQGANDKGVAKLEGDRTIDGFFCGDPGNSIRAVVNAGFEAHANFMTDRVAYINGNSGQSSSAAISDVASYRSIRTCYVDPWVYIFDDVTGAKTLVPAACFAASVAAQLPPSTSIGWKDDAVQAMLSGIQDLEADRGEATADLTDAGISVINREDQGGFTFEAGVNTFNPSNPAKGTLARTRMGHYLGRSIATSLRSNVDAPNVPVVQEDEVHAVSTFLGTLEKNAKSGDPARVVHILKGVIGDLNAANAQADLDAGEFSIPVEVKTSASQAKIFVLLTYGETVNPTAQVAL